VKDSDSAFKLSPLIDREVKVQVQQVFDARHRENRERRQHLEKEWILLDKAVAKHPNDQ